MYKLGKKPARKHAVQMRLDSYMKPAMRELEIPDTFGHYDLVSGDIGVLGNDQYGDCVFAGAAHETMLWNAEAKRSVVFDTPSVLGDYSAVTGFNPNKPETDQGTDMELAAKYRRQTGVRDAQGNRHRVGAYLGIDVGNLSDLTRATYLFGATGVGIMFPDSAMEQFAKGEKWDVVAHSSVEGGHYIPIVGHDGDYLLYTWGKLQRATPDFIEKYMDEAVAYISEEALTNGLSLEGFNLDQLQNDLASL